MPDIRLLLRIQNCRLWSGLVKPLEGINLEGVEYISPEMEKELGYREEFARHSWEKVQEELRTTGMLEEKVLELAEKVAEISANEHYFADGKNVRVVKRQKVYNVYHTCDTYCYIFPILVRDAHDETSALVSPSVLSQDREFLANIELLEKEYKPEYSKGSRDNLPAGPVFDKKSIRKMLSDNALVEAEKLRENASELVKNLTYCKAAYERRQAFRAEVMKRSNAGTFDYAINEKHEVADEWYNTFIAGVYARIKEDEEICRLINGQSAGKFWTSWTKSTRFEPKLTNAYQQKTLSPEGFRKWVDSYDASPSLKLALQGLDIKTRLLGRIGSRLQEQYTHKDNKDELFISEQEYFDIFPAAAKRLTAAFDGGLLAFLPKTAP